MTSIYEAIRRVALGDNPRLVLMDMVPGKEDGGEAFEGEAFEEDDELEESEEDVEDDEEDDLGDDDEEDEEPDTSDYEFDYDSVETVELDPSEIPPE